jgi:predicted amidohydrolase YtcJ
VQGRGWDQNRWPEKTFPNHAALSAAVPDHPVVLRRVDGHAVLTNARGLALAGITATTKDPPGGRILRDDAGSPTGVLVDAAEEILDRAVPDPTAVDIERRVLLACEHLAAVRYHRVPRRGHRPIELAAAQAGRSGGSVRVYAMLDGE